MCVIKFDVRRWLFLCEKQAEIFAKGYVVCHHPEQKRNAHKRNQRQTRAGLAAAVLFLRQTLARGAVVWIQLAHICV